MEIGIGHACDIGVGQELTQKGAAAAWTGADDVGFITHLWILCLFSFDDHNARSFRNFRQPHTPEQKKGPNRRWSLLILKSI